ncbi:MAG: hypothetical protein GY920_07245 [Aliivibrio sp.]|nr:hypothetical protein [Aliivibrio sp.]
MSGFKIPATMKIIYVASLLLGVTGVYFKDDVSVVVSILSLIILSCSISILEAIDAFFEKQIKTEIERHQHNRG